jgi:hypothetical protein
MIETKATIEIGTHSVKKWTIRFKPWGGAPIADTYGGKAVLDWHGEPVFAELAIVRLCQSDGFDAVWIDTYGKRFRSSISEEYVLPRNAQTLLNKVIVCNDGRRQGCWDVLAWSGEKYIFIESKRKGKDHIRQS